MKVYDRKFNSIRFVQGNQRVYKDRAEDGKQ